MIEVLRDRIINSRIIGGYYKFQNYVDIGWKEVSWFNYALVEIMAVVFLLEKIGIKVVEETLVIVIVCAFVFFYLFGLLLKAIGVYDKSVYVDTDIDPVRKEVLEAARIIKQRFVMNKRKAKADIPVIYPLDANSSISGEHIILTCDKEIAERLHGDGYKIKITRN